MSGFLKLANPSASLEGNIRASREPVQHIANFTSMAQRRVDAANSIIASVNAAREFENEPVNPAEFQGVFESDGGERGEGRRSSPFTEGGGTFKLPSRDNDTKNVRDERAAQFLNIDRIGPPSTSSGIGTEAGVGLISTVAGAAGPVGLAMASIPALAALNDALGSAEFEDIRQPDGTIVRLRNGRPVARYRNRIHPTEIMERYEYSGGNVTVIPGPKFSRSSPGVSPVERVKGTPFTKRT